MYVGAGLLVGVTIILVGWVFCFCLFSVFLLGCRAWSFSSPLLSLFNPGRAFKTSWCFFFGCGWRCTLFGLVECPAGALPLSPAGALSSSLAGTLSTSPAGAHFIEPSRCSFSDTGGLSSSLVLPLSCVEMTLFPKSR